MQTYPPGTRIGQYEIVSRPMMGGMGVVYFALDHGNDRRPVALKTFRPEFLPDHAARDRFLREGTAWVKLGKHPHIVRCYKAEYIDFTTAFLVLELVAKESHMPDASLRSWLIPGHSMPIEQTLLFALQIARGMQHATNKIPGFVHRDLKPENILVGADRLFGTNTNRLQVTDFGLVKTIVDAGIPAVIIDAVELKPERIQFTYGIGTPLYMAPEQWMGEVVGVFTDVYALGCILYEMIMGQHVVEGKTINQLKDAHCNGKIKPMSGAISTNVLALLTKCLMTDPNQRYKNWDELTYAIEHAYAKQSKKTVPQVTESEDFTHEERLEFGRSYNDIGLAYLDIGKPDVAVDYLEKSLMMTNEVGDQHGERAATSNLGVAYIQLGKVRKAIGYLEDSLEIALKIKDQIGIENVVVNLGIAYLNIGDVHRAINYFEQALTIARKVGDRRGEVNAVGNLGSAYRHFGDIQKATNCFEQALAIAREVGDRRREGTALDSLGGIYRHFGDIQKATNCFEQALAIAREVGDRHGEGGALNSLGTIYFQQGNVPQAISCFEQALVMAREMKDRDGEGGILGNLGAEYAELGDMKRAISYFEQALTITRELGDENGASINLINLGSAYHKLQDVPRAISYFEQALTIAHKISNLGVVGHALGHLGADYAQLGDAEKAIDYLNRAIKIHRQVGDLDAVAHVSLDIAVLSLQQGEIANAMLFAKEAEQIWTQIGSPYVKQAQELIAQLNGRKRANQVQTAFEAFQRAISIQDMQVAVQQYSFMMDESFMQAIEEIIADQIPDEHKPAFKQRLDWLRQIANQK
jgi:tetratricopeptide (TPR) repeat protein